MGCSLCQYDVNEGLAQEKSERWWVAGERFNRPLAFCHVRGSLTHSRLDRPVNVGLLLIQPLITSILLTYCSSWRLLNHLPSKFLGIISLDPSLRTYETLSCPSFATVDISSRGFLVWKHTLLIATTAIGCSISHLAICIPNLSQWTRPIGMSFSFFISFVTSPLWFPFLPPPTSAMTGQKCSLEQTWLFNCYCYENITHPITNSIPAPGSVTSLEFLSMFSVEHSWTLIVTGLQKAWWESSVRTKMSSLIASPWLKMINVSGLGCLAASILSIDIPLRTWPLPPPIVWQYCRL